MFGLPISVVVNQFQNLAMLAGGAIIAKGYVTNDQFAAIVGGIVALVTAISNHATHQAALDAAPAPKAVAAAPVKPTLPSTAG